MNCPEIFRNITEANSPVRHLGIYFNKRDINTKLMERKLIERIKEKINTWKYHQLTVNARVLLSNTYLSSKIFYVVKFFPVSKEFTQEINRILKMFIWNNKNSNCPDLNTLTLHCKDGGLGLLNPIEHSKKLFKEWLDKVVSAPRLLPC